MILGVPRSVQSLYSQEQMHLVLHRERLRVDRNNGAVSMISFDPAEPCRRTNQRLARIVLGRVRLTDEAGWLGRNRLGIILPDTGEAGARALAEDLVDRCRSRGLDVDYELRAYPLSGSDDADRGEPRDGDRRGRRPERILEPAYDEEEDPSAQPLEPVLAHGLPFWKRAVDIVGASIGLLLAAPIMLVSAALIRLTSNGPVFFKQRRAGLGGEEFTILKFRTMITDAEALKPQLRAVSEQDGPAFKLSNDPRITTIGRFLRTTSFDELPQFWNVLKGTMSLVGPRPLPLDEADACHGWQRRRLDVTPGLTCIWQVKGRSRVAFDDWMRMDMQYIRNRSFLYDLKILLLTIPAVILRRGAH